MTLTMVHFQLTLDCNLNCPFCSQRHHQVPPDAMRTGDWLRLIDELAGMQPRPTLVLWGGEPLAYPGFDEVARHAVNAGLELELITNGTMIDRYSDLLKNEFARIYVSIDAPEAIHDRFRGKGVFRKTAQNLSLLRGGHAELIMMTLLLPETMQHAAKVSFGLPVDRVILHQQIGGNAVYRAQLAVMLNTLRHSKFPLPVEFQPHGTAAACCEPRRHLHVRADGETGFCTDYTHYTLGNVRDHTLQEIFHGERSAEYRRRIAAGEFPCCNSCSWRNTPETIFHFSHNNKLQTKKQGVYNEKVL